MSKNTKTFNASLVFILLSWACFGSTVYAQESYWYGAVSVGKGSTSASGFRDSTTASFYIGNRVSRSAAIEVAYVDLGEFDFKRLSDSHIDVKGFEVSGLGLAKIGDSVDLFGKVGFYLWELDATSLGNKTAEEDDTSILFGFGVKVPLGQTIGARFEWVTYRDIEDEDVDSLNLGLYAKF